MSIGAHTISKDCINRYHNLCDNQCYIDNGLGCKTITYKNVAEARAIVHHLGRIPNGRDVKLCKVCSCNYSNTDKKHKFYPEFACRWYRDSIPTLAKHILEKNPSIGRKQIKI
jgi:hypothetical protein